ncbi:peptide chain release factor 1 [Candidatus Woesearchaeota archaeon CG10_big_fil_rev_8_21_14_0_10_37_12]|nr:MAG: peptide chain release factor 1 [Candidatus Woesearchaeota archaeon CG10_big_fil_rev_8_21_14_0_10_37_12]
MSTITANQRYHLKKFIKELDSHSARHTEFVTVYVPAGYDIIKIIQHLAQEQGTATNIKSASTQKNVISALERMIQHLRLFKQTPPNGLAVFAGNVASFEGKSDVRVWSIEPPIPINTRIYRCDKNFQIELLQEMLNVKEAFGLIVIDARDAHIALLKGKAILPLIATHSHVPGKMRAGGQSSVRFARNREIAVNEHFKKVAEYVKEQFLNMEGLKGILLGGPGPTKYQFFDSGHITTEVKKKIIAIKDLSYTGDFGLEELLEKSQDTLAKEDIAEEKKLVSKFLEMLAREPNKVAYGQANVRKALDMGAIDKLLLSESLDESLIDEFESLAKNFSTETILISTETREGAQLRDIGKIGAILRYPIA